MINRNLYRDLKPGNIFLLKETMQVKIGDFGLACLDHINKEENMMDNISPDEHEKDNGNSNLF